MSLISDYLSYHGNHIAPNQFVKKFPTNFSIYFQSRRFQTKNPSIVKETLSGKELYSIVFIESTRLPPMWPGFKSWRQRHMWVEFVVGSLRCSERFFSVYSGFPSPQKPTFSNSNSTRNRVDEEPLCGCDTCKSLFIYYLFIYCSKPVKPTKSSKSSCLTEIPPHVIEKMKTKAYHFIGVDALLSK